MRLLLIALYKYPHLLTYLLTYLHWNRPGIFRPKEGWPGTTYKRMVRPISIQSCKQFFTRSPCFRTRQR